MAGSSFSLHCRAAGQPAPAVSWIKGGDTILSDSDGSRIQVLESSTTENSLVIVNSTLVISNLMLTDEDTYTCRATNEFGTDNQIVSEIIVQGIAECILQYSQ